MMICPIGTGAGVELVVMNPAKGIKIAVFISAPERSSLDMMWLCDLITPPDCARKAKLVPLLE
jgi:hypothetical protein